MFNNDAAKILYEKRKKKIKIDEKIFPSVKDAAIFLRVTEPTVRNIIKRDGWHKGQKISYYKGDGKL